jgi:NADH-quinone oxidoreductase subunit N
MNLLAFASLPANGDDAARDRLDTLKGLFHRSPYAAIAIGIAMLSLAGIPPFPGFVAKFLIFRNVMAAGYTTYAVLGLVASYLGIYFYLRVIQYLFMTPQAADAEVRGAERLALGASMLCLVPALLLVVVPGWVLARL